MFKPLRIRLTLLYLLVAMLLASLVGLSAYSLLYFYFQNNNDTALQYKMADIFTSIGVNRPNELVRAEENWITINNGKSHDESSEAEGEEEYESPEYEESEHEEDSVTPVQISTTANAYEGELISIFVLPLDNQGRLLFNPNPYQPPMDPDLAAVSSASNRGSDLRNSQLSDGSPVRLLTYRVPEASGYSYIQLGKPINDQTRVLNQFVSGLLLIGAISVLLLGLGSWLLAGRYLRNTQYAWDMQQAFVANASHELRTPLTLMRASAEVAQRHSQEDQKQVALLDDIVQEVDHMSQLVDDLLLLSRLDAHQLKFEKQVIDLPALAADIQRQFEPVAVKRNIQIVNQVSPGSVLADRTRLRQVLIVLIDNALRHTPAGGRIRIESASEGRNTRISITDNGEGISPNDLSHVFERFYQVNTTRNVDHQGAGLGLPIARSLVEAQDGTIRIESQVGMGTRVSISLPSARSRNEK